MIELKKDQLCFTFPEIHPQARLRIELQRTLRITDDDKTYPLPPGLGRFPIRHVDDFAGRVPETWIRHGGVAVPLYQSEALWLNFQTSPIARRGSYPFAIKIATGKIDAVSGEPYRPALHRSPQDYVVAPQQPWLDGYCVARGTIRQFVAMPLGAGYSAEEQVTGEAAHDGLQIQVFPMRRASFDRLFPEQPDLTRRRAKMTLSTMLESPALCRGTDMGLAPGGRMKKEIFDDRFALEDWETRQTSRCFVHLANSMVWQAITGESPPQPPPTAADYSRHGLPWLDCYGRDPALEGSSVLAKLKSVFQLGEEKGGVPLPENESTVPENVIVLRQGLAKNQVREGRF